MVRRLHWQRDKSVFITLQICFHIFFVYCHFIPSVLITDNSFQHVFAICVCDWSHWTFLKECSLFWCLWKVTVVNTKWGVKTVLDWRRLRGNCTSLPCQGRMLSICKYGFKRYLLSCKTVIASFFANLFIDEGTLTKPWRGNVINRNLGSSVHINVFVLHWPSVFVLEAGT